MTNNFVHGEFWTKNFISRMFCSDILKFERLRESMMAEFRGLDFKPHTAELGGPGVLFHHVT